MTPVEEQPSAAARDRLLETAIDIFGRHGFEAATTRMIVKEAGVNISAIPYYFGGKQGLYQAAVAHIVERIKKESGGLVEMIANTPSFTGESGRQKARELTRALVERFIGFIAGTEQGPRFAKIILREQMYPSQAYPMIFEGFMKPILNSFATLIMAVTGEPSPRRAKLRAAAVMGQLVIFRVGRETVVRALDLEGYSASEVEEIKEVVVAHTMAILGISEETSRTQEL